MSSPTQPGAEDTEAAKPPRSTRLTVRQAAFIGVGAMVGAGIFSLLGPAGETAGAAVWVSFLIAHAQTVVVIVVLGSLSVFAVATLTNIEPGLLASANYPAFRDIVASVALTFFAFLGFGVITFTAKDLPNPSRQIPRAVYLALGIATVIYVAIALGVFGTLPVNEVIDAGATAIAVAAEPILGNVGFWMMSITALFATAGATNAGLYPATGLADELTADGQFPPLMGARSGRLPNGLLLTAIGSVGLVLFFSLSAVASIGSAIALVVFALITAGHIRVRQETGAQIWLLLLGVFSSGIVLLAFDFTTLVEEPGTAITMVVFLILSILFDFLWKRRRATTSFV